MRDVQSVPLHEATRERYLTYALSVVTSRALPDVRDGLKPVQRRILYTMYTELGLRPDSRYRKCAAVVGDVMGKFHPHGDTAIYDALVRMAQDFTLRAPLVDGQGNFGSLDGDRAAAMRYTECRLRPLAVELLAEIKKRTVDFRPNYDGQRFEPVVLPAQFPQLLVNGSEGIAVGMATRIPPHNLGEVIDATVHLIDQPDATVRDLVQHVQGPDFPTGSRILNDPDEIVQFYEEGSGSFRLRADWHEEKDGRRRLIVLTSVPYGQNKAKVIERIGLEVQQKNLPQVVDVRDESTEDTRVVLELKQGASAEAAMAYLFKKTPLQATFPMNLTALIPQEGTPVPRPARLDLVSVLRHWLDFRFETVRRRFEYDLAQLRERIHILEGFAIIFDALDEAIAIIRASQGKRDAHEKLIDRFDLSDVQADAILELRLYKLAQLEIQLVRDELDEKRAEAERIEGILASDRELWSVVREELLELRKLYADDRRTTVGEPVRQLDYDENAYIVDENAFVVVTRGGWIKRQGSFSEIDKIRIRDDDEIGWLVEASTRTTLTLFGSSGRAYVIRVDDVPATTGYGEPVQATFDFADGERVVGVVPHDPRHWPDEQPPPGDDEPDRPWAIAVLEQGKVLRFSLTDHAEPSTRKGRKYARPGKGDAVFWVAPVSDEQSLALVSTTGNGLVFPTTEVSVLKAAGKGVTGMKLPKNGRIVAARLVSDRSEGPTVVTSFGREVTVREGKFGGSRGNKGGIILKRGSIDEWLREGPDLWLTEPDDDELDEDAPTDEVSADGGEQ